MASSALIWQCVKRNNAGIRKGINGELFSAERGNVLNKHSYKYSGYVGKAVDIGLDGETMTVAVKTKGGLFKPGRMCKGARRANHAVAKLAGVRKDLAAKACARATLVSKAIVIGQKNKKN